MNSRHVVSVVALSGFAFFALGTSKAKEDGPPKETKTTSANAEATLKEAKVVGGCDRSDQFYKDCTESYAPEKPAEEKKKCESLGGKFLLGGCPRIGATTMCLEGNAPYLSGSVAYEGRKTKHDPDDCKRGFTDFSKGGGLKANTSPASCNAVATGGTCTQFSALTADAERTCLQNGGQLKQPPEPCPSANGLAAFKIPLKDGTTETEYFYTTEYTDLTGKHTWTMEDVLVICGLSGNCTKVPFETGAAAASGSAPAGSAKPAAVPATAAKKAPDPKKK